MFRKSLILGFLLALCSSGVSSKDAVAPFSGSRLSGLTRSSTIFESDSTIDASGNLIDKSGSNYLTYSNAFGSWTATRSSILADQYRNPVTNALDADVLREDGTAGNSHFVYNTYSTTSGVKYTFSAYVKSSFRTWVRLNVNTDAASAYFNLSTGVAGTTASNTTTKLVPIGGGWYRCAIHWTSVTTGAQQFEIYAAEGDNDVTFDGTLDRQDLVLFGGQLNRVDSYRQLLSIYKPTTSATKPLLNMSSSGTPAGSTSYLQGADGRRHRARHFVAASMQSYSVAADTSMNIFDGDFTFTSVAGMSGAASQGTLFRHSSAIGPTAGGFDVVASHVNYVYAELYKADGTTLTVAGPATNINDGKYHTIQVKRTSNVVKVLVDGTPGSPANATGYGVDLTQDMYIGTGFGYWNGDILYTRVDAEALSDAQLAKEREIIQGTLFGSGGLAPGSTFTRAASTTSTSQTFSDGTLGYVGTNVPRVSGDGGGVLIEEQRTNSVLQSQTLAATWTSVNLTTISADGTTAPDSAATADGLVGDVTDGIHGITQGITTTAASWTASIWAKIGDKNWIYISDDTVANAYSYFNVATCSTGTKGAGATYARAEQYAGGWCRCWIMLTATAASNTFKFASASSDTDNTFAGDTATVNTWFWGAQVELGAHPTSYIPTVAASVIRYADSLTIEPWKLTKPSVGPRPTMAARFESDVYATGTYTSEVGGYAFTVAGDTKHVESQTLGDYFSFDGTGDYLSVAGADFNPAGDFSIVAIVTPSTISGVHVIASKWATAGDQRGWMLFQDSASTRLYRSTDGKSGTILSATAAVTLVVGKTSLITATYSTTNGLSVKVDSSAVATQAATGAVWGSTADFILAQSAVLTGAEAFNGKLHSVAYYSGVVLTETQHNAMYAAFKQANILPVNIGNSYEAKKLYVEFDAKCEFTGSTDIGSSAKYMLEIGGNTGSAEVSKNRFTAYIAVGGTVGMDLRDNSSVQHYGTSAATTGWNTWHRFKYYADCADMTKMQMLIDGIEVASYTGRSGTCDFDLTNALIRVGQTYAGTPNCNCTIRNLKLRATP